MNQGRIAIDRSSLSARSPLAATRTARRDVEGVVVAHHQDARVLEVLREGDGDDAPDARR